MATVRFNLICHGLMAFWQKDAEGKWLEIWIPNELNHAFRVGCPAENEAGLPECSAEELEVLPASQDLRLQGVTSSSGLGMKSIAASFLGPVLKGQLFKPSPDPNDQPRIKITVPMPWRSRSYRIAEVDRRDVQGNTHDDLIERIPDRLAEVVVLSWKIEGENPDIYLTDSKWRRSAQLSKACNEAGDQEFWSLGIYSQPLGQVDLHGTTWNQMFRVKTTSATPDLHLALKDAIPDGAPHCTSIGVEKCQLLSLHELAELAELAQQGKPGPSTTMAGCGAGCFCC